MNAFALRICVSIMTCKPLFVLPKNSSLQVIAIAILKQLRNCLVTPIFAML